MFNKTIEIFNKLLKILEKICLPLLVLFIRFWMSKIFWHSGVVKVSNWQSAIFLFKEEFKVSIISSEIAAYITTFFELACPILLVLGLASRLSTLPLLAITAAIQFTYVDLIDHLYWAILLAVILFYGPGSLSLDYLIARKFKKEN